MKEFFRVRKDTGKLFNFVLNFSACKRPQFDQNSLFFQCFDDLAGLLGVRLIDSAVNTSDHIF